MKVGHIRMGLLLDGYDLEAVSTMDVELAKYGVAEIKLCVWYLGKHWSIKRAVTNSSCFKRSSRSCRCTSQFNP